MKEEKLLRSIGNIDGELILEAKEPAIKLRRPIKLALIAAAVVLLLTAVVGGAYVLKNWDTIFEVYFAPEDAVRMALDNAMTDVNVSETKNGITYTVRQIMGDTHSILMAVEIQLPEDVTVPTVNVAELEALAEKNGYYEEGQLREMLEDTYGYDGVSETFCGIIDVGAFELGPGHIEEDAFMEQWKKADAVGASNVGLDLLNAMPHSDGAKMWGGRLRYSSFDPEKNVLTLLLQAYQDRAWSGKAYTLALWKLYVEDWMDRFSRPAGTEDDSENEENFARTNLMEEPVLLCFDADFVPYTSDYDVYLGEEKIGTAQLSPMSLYFDLPRPERVKDVKSGNFVFPRDTVMGKRWRGYIYALEKEYGRDWDRTISILLADGTEIACKPSSGGMAHGEHLYTLPEKLFRLEDVAEIRVKGLTLVPGGE